MQDGCYYDIYLIDIEMSGMNGLELAQAIRIKYGHPFIVFITNYAAYSREGYRYSVWRYILKDEVKDRLPEALDSICIQLQNSQKKYYLTETAQGMYRIPYDEIAYLMVDGKYIDIHMLAHTEPKIRVRKTLKKMFEELQDDCFLFIDKGIIVNIMHVMRMENQCLVLRNDEKLPVSGPQYQKVKRALRDYWSKI